MRCLENSDGSILFNKENSNIFKYLNKKELELKKISVGGIAGIKSVKTSKKLIMDPSLQEKV